VSLRNIRAFDTTLRDGEQSPGVALQVFAGASPGHFEQLFQQEVLA
jgi:hypothetical protein